MFFTLSSCCGTYGMNDNAIYNSKPTIDHFYWANVSFTYTDPKTGQNVTETASGKFGLESIVDRKSGVIFHVKDNYGCTPNYTQEPPDKPWIALIERGECYFSKKIDIATNRHHAAAAVIYNNRSEKTQKDGYTIMQHKGNYDIQ